MENSPEQIRKHIERQGLPLKVGRRTTKKWITHGAHSVVRSYLSGAIDRRYALGQIITELERQYAKHKGYDSLKACPITLADTIRLIVAQKLFLASYEPDGSKNGYRDFNTAVNSMGRLVASLGLDPAEKPVLTLQEYLRHEEEQEGAEESK